MSWNLQESLIITFWISLGDYPWYIMVAVIFKDKLRIKKPLFIGFLSGALILYSAATFLIAFYINTPHSLYQFFVRIFYLLMIAFFVFSVKIFWGKFLYIFLLIQALTYMTGSLAFIICERILGAEAVSSYTHPPLSPALFISFNAIIIFVLLRFLIKPFLEILDEISSRSALYLCTAPFLFFIAQEVLLGIHNSVTSKDMPMIILLRLLLIFTGITTYTINLLTVRETSKRLRLEADHQFAMNVISSGKEYYEKLMVLSERLNLQQHDYKHHLNALQKMLACGYTESSQNYLDKLNKETSDNQIREYCSSRVINSLLDSFAERCVNENINFSVNSYLPDKRRLDDYELCVILGNLLENAFTACLTIESGRYIELRAKLQRDNLGITVKNSFNGEITVKDGGFVSKKENGGNGIKSIQSILNHYGGDFVPKWDESNFTVCAVVDITK